MPVLISRINEFHHRLLRPFLREGDRVVDCTAGNGYDTLYLAEAVGGTGHVYGFDIQKDALTATRDRLLGAGIADGRFTLVLDSHENLDHHVSPGISAAVFNLGYLPGGRRPVVTEGDSTIRSIEKGLNLLRPEGMVSVTLYFGHDGGRREAAAVTEYAGSLDPSLFKVLRLTYPNLPNDPPSILLIQRSR
jgi:SAM-dependent methyltransferase